MIYTGKISDPKMPRTGQASFWGAHPRKANGFCSYCNTLEQLSISLVSDTGYWQY
jgi:hypothetical protein